LNGVPGYGLSTAEGIRPVGAVFAARYPDLQAVLAAGALADAAAAARANPRRPDPGAIAYDPVIPRPGKILCVGINFLAHLREMGHELPTHPVIFTRFADSLVGHEQPLMRPRASERYDFEGELACVIGRRGRDVGERDALAHVAGYGCFMDGSVRDFQYRTSQFTPGKNFPASGAFGPWLVTPDEAGDPAALQLETRLNGAVMQRAPISDMRFGVAALVAYCSTFVTLEPGDVISTGTPSGVGAARKPPVWLRDGDVLEVDLGPLGTLRNTVRDESE
jgi:2-keto-4-pentenoate hydratase/2-oxohepta-3-ene-1,7-dioic acid hydratase in catechol pathway